jgi:tetratricopeptide (TPR) repeat protein
MFNKYTIASILNEIKWALDPSNPYAHEMVLIENGEGLYEDYQLTGSNYADTLQNARLFREAFNRAFSSLKSADVVVITLGLSEAWLDRQTGLYLNHAPSRDVVRKYPNRFDLCVLDYEESLSKLDEIYGLLEQTLSPGYRVLITVSPVPLLATFREQDVLVANAYSKAVLRTVVEKFQQGKSNVNYFPSYEFVTLSNPASVWGEEDYRHVDRFFVEHIMGAVLSHFCSATREQKEAAALAKASALYRGKFFEESARVLQPLMDSSEVEDPKVVLRWAMAQRQLKNVEAARKAYEEYVRRCPDDDKVRAVLARL